MREIRRYEVPVDDAWHEIELRDPLSMGAEHVGCRRVDVVEFWAVHDDEAQPKTFSYLVVGTGHSLPEDADYAGTAVAPGGQLVWHLMERAPRMDLDLS